MLNVTRLGINPAQINKESESIDQSGLMIHVCRIYINIYSEYNEKGHEYTVGLYNRAEWCHLLFAYVCRTHFGSNSASLLFERERDRRKRGVREALLLWRPAWGWLYPSGLILVLYLWACALTPPAAPPSRTFSLITAVPFPQRGNQTHLSDEQRDLLTARGVNAGYNSKQNIVSGFCAWMCTYTVCVCVSKKTSDIESEAGRADENGGWHGGRGEIQGKLTVTTFTITGIRGHMLWNHNTGRGEQMVKTQKNTHKYTLSDGGRPGKPWRNPNVNPVQRKKPTLLHQQGESPGRNSHTSVFPSSFSTETVNRTVMCTVPRSFSTLL